MLKYDLLEFQSWSRCPPTCVGQGVAPNSNLPGASLILYLNLLTHSPEAAIEVVDIEVFILDADGTVIDIPDIQCRLATRRVFEYCFGNQDSEYNCTHCGQCGHCCDGECLN